MKKSGAFLLAIFLVLIFIPSVLFAAYLYPESAALQPLAVIEPATPDGLFHSWTGEINRAGRTNLGISLDFLRNADNSDDWDEFLSATGSYRYADKFLFGITLPVIIRDSEFNKSDPLDFRGFARMKLVGSNPGFGISGEVSAILPTARKNVTYPFTLDSSVVGFRLAIYGRMSDMSLGLNLGYQSYLQTESGDDSDLLYSTWLEKDLNGPWSLVAEFSGSQHSHSGPPGDDEVSDNYLLIGVRRAHSKRTNFGIAAGSGIGGGSAADIRLTALATVKFGAVEEKVIEKRKTEKKVKIEEKKKEGIREKVTPAPPPSAIVVVMIAEGIANRETEKRITRALQRGGYATGSDPDPGIKSTGRNILYYMPGMQKRALQVSKALISGGHLKALKVEVSKVRLPGSWLLLILGGEK